MSEPTPADDTTTVLTDATAPDLAPPTADATALDDAGPDRTAGAAIARDPRPRTRWAGIVWGLVFAGLAWAGIWLASGENRVEDIVVWAQDLDPATAIGYGILAVGGLLLVTGVVGLLRRAQRRVSELRRE